MKQVRRGLTLSALHIFIHHFFSLSWLRGYLIEKNVYNFVHKDEEDEEYDAYAGRTDPLQKYFHVLFLVRTAHEQNPTAELLLEISKHLDALQSHTSLVQNSEVFYTTLNEIYFAAGVCRKVSLSNGELADSWKKVAKIPLQQQLTKGFYAEAKLKEMTALEDFAEEDVTNSDKQELLKTWVKTECQLSVIRERKKSKEDLLKYYQLLSMEAKNEGNLKLSEYWARVNLDYQDKDGLYSEDNLLLAWSLQRIVSKKNDAILSPVGVIWQATAGFVIEEDYGASFSTAQLGFELEKTLTDLHRSGKYFNQFVVPNNNPFVSNLRDAVSDVLNKIRSVLLFKLLKPIDSRNFNMFEKISSHVKESFRNLQMDWEKASTSLIGTIQRKDELVDFYKDCPDLVAFVENKFQLYFDELVNHFTKERGFLPNVRRDLFLDDQKIEPVRRYLELFPFRDELLYHSMKSRESPNDSVHLEVIQVIFSLQQFLVETHSQRKKIEDERTANLGMRGLYGFDNDDDKHELSLDKVNFTLELLQSSSISDFKKKLCVEYLKCCLEFLTVDLQYVNEQVMYFVTRSVVQRDSAVFLKVQDWIAQVEDLASEKAIACWKALDLLRVLPRVENYYFKSLLIWMLDELLAGNEVNPLLMESLHLVPLPENVRELTGDKNDSHFAARMLLLKYFLPEKYFIQIEEDICVGTTSLVDDKSSRYLKEQLTSLLEHTFCGKFSPKAVMSDEFKRLVPYICLLPAVKAFKNRKGGLLSEWGLWKSPGRRSRPENPFHVALQNQLLSIKDRNDLGNSDDYYSQLNLSMVAENLIEEWNPRHELVFENDTQVKWKIKPTAQCFLGRSMKLFTEADDLFKGQFADNLKANCLHVSSLYLEFVELEKSCQFSKEQPIVEFERIYSEMTRCIEGQSIVKLC
jgi:hypothetical protein